MKSLLQTTVLLAILAAASSVRASGLPSESPPSAGSPAASAIFVVTHRDALARTAGGALARVLDACSPLTGGDKERLIFADEAYRRELDKPLEVDAYPTSDATEKARWLRGWLSRRVPAGSTIVLLGDETALPRWSLRLGSLQLTTDSPYTDLDEDGVPDTAVARVIGAPEVMIRQLQGKRDHGKKAVILCSEDTRIHLETRAFAGSLSRLGYDVAIRGTRDDGVLVESDFIVHFGHGSPANISNRFGETFAAAGDRELLPRSPIVFVDGCGTLPVGSPLLHSLIERGALGYCGATATVQGMTPSRYTNELVEHFLAALEKEPSSTLPRLLASARAAYVEGHTGLAELLRQLAKNGEVLLSGDDASHLLAVTEWVYYGDPRAAIPAIGAPRPLSRKLAGLDEPARLAPDAPSWRAEFTAEEGDGQAVLALFVDVPRADRGRFRLSVHLDGQERYQLDGRSDTVYQNLGQDCRGGHIRGDLYQGRYLLPLSGSRIGAGRRELEVRLAAGESAEIAPGTEIVVWPPDFAEAIGLRHAPLPRSSARTILPVNGYGRLFSPGPLYSQLSGQSGTVTQPSPSTGGGPPRKRYWKMLMASERFRPLSPFASSRVRFEGCAVVPFPQGSRAGEPR